MMRKMRRDQASDYYNSTMSSVQVAQTN